MSDFTEKRDEAMDDAKKVAQTFGQWFQEKPWTMTAIVFVCVVIGVILGKIF
jgi:ElaB/YqjD/DUF883 family membrane-anchored ribosome-binding protein